MGGTNETIAGIAVDMGLASERQMTALFRLVEPQLSVTHLRRPIARWADLLGQRGKTYCGRYGRRRR